MSKSNFNWPPEKTFRYEFNENLELEIPVKDGGKNYTREESKDIDR